MVMLLSGQSGFEFTVKHFAIIIGRIRNLMGHSLELI